MKCVRSDLDLGAPAMTFLVNLVIVHSSLQLTLVLKKALIPLILKPPLYLVTWPPPSPIPPRPRLLFTGSMVRALPVCTSSAPTRTPSPGESSSPVPDASTPTKPTKKSTVDELRHDLSHLGLDTKGKKETLFRYVGFGSSGVRPGFACRRRCRSASFRWIHSYRLKECQGAD